MPLKSVPDYPTPMDPSPVSAPPRPHQPMRPSASSAWGQPLLQPISHRPKLPYHLCTIKWQSYLLCRQEPRREKCELEPCGTMPEQYVDSTVLRAESKEPDDLRFASGDTIIIDEEGKC